MGIAEAWFVQKVVGSKRRKPAGKAAAGWFYDPRKEAKYRFWDGAGWTDDTAAEIPR